MRLSEQLSLGASEPATHGRFKTSQASGSLLNTITDSVLVVLLYFSLCPPALLVSNFGTRWLEIQQFSRITDWPLPLSRDLLRFGLRPDGRIGWF